MRKFLSFLLISFFVCFSVSAKTLEQKKSELKKIYEAGGISKIEYKKAQEFLEVSIDKKKEKKKKRSFTLKNKTKKSKKSSNKKKKEEEKEEITQEKIKELGEIVKFDKSYFPETMVKATTWFIYN